MVDEIRSPAHPFIKLRKTFRPPLVALAVVGAVVVSATLFYGLRYKAKPEAEAPPPPPQEVPVVKTVTALGRIEPRGEVIQLSPPPTLGSAKIALLLVTEGDRVEAGQTVAILDNQPLRVAEVIRAEKEVEVAKAYLAIVQAGAKIGEIEAQKATIARLQAQLQGEIVINQAKVGNLEAQLQGEIQEQQATIERLKAELINAQTEFNRYQTLFTSGAISSSDLDNRRLTLDTAGERLEEAQAAYSKTRTTLEQQLLEAKAVEQTTAAVTETQILEAKANLDRIAEVRYVDVQQARAEVERAIAALQQAQANLELTYVRAPATHQVLKIHTRPGESVGDEGIADLGKTNQMMVVAEVYESDIGKVKLGQKATITSESRAFEGKLHGTVGHVGLQIGKNDVLDTDPAADVDTRVVEVKIFLTPEDSQRVAELTYSKVVAEILPKQN